MCPRLDASYVDNKTVPWHIEGTRVRVTPAEAKHMYHFERLLPRCAPRRNPTSSLPERL